MAIAFKDPFVVTVFLFQACLLVLFAILVNYDQTINGKTGSAGDVINQFSAAFDAKYKPFLDVHWMVFCGFGFLFMFLKKNAYTGFGISFITNALLFQWAILTWGFWDGSWGGYSQITLNVLSLTAADFACVSWLVAFAIVLGKVTPLQALISGIFEIGLYTLNQKIIMASLTIADLGGSIGIYIFGACFGLGLTFFFSTKEAVVKAELASPNYVFDLFSLIGTIVLWLCFPSFNSVMAPTFVGATYIGESVAHRAVVNTVIALMGSVVTTFFTSALLRDGKFELSDIQRATLAGGIAMGSAAGYTVQPYGALIVGLLAGIFSTAGLVYVTPIMSLFGFHDTTGSFSTFFFPGFLGGMTSLFACLLEWNNWYDSNTLSALFPSFASRSLGKQAGIQFAAIVITMGIALVGGLVVGFVVKLLFSAPKDMFTDDEFFNMDKKKFDDKVAPAATMELPETKKAQV